jgi:hypothetical protein
MPFALINTAGESTCALNAPQGNKPWPWPGGGAVATVVTEGVLLLGKADVALSWACVSSGDLESHAGCGLGLV